MVSQHSLKLLLRTGIALGILILLFRFIPVSDVLAALLFISIPYLVLGLAIVLIKHFLTAYQMRLLINHQGISLNTYQVFQINMLTQFYSLFLPGDLAGGAIRWYHFSRPNKKRAEAVAAIGLNRFLETLMIISLGILFWLLDRQARIEQSAFQALSFIFLFLIGMYLLFFSRAFHRYLIRLCEVRHLPSFLSEKIIKVLRAFEQYAEAGAAFHFGILSICFFRQIIGISGLLAFAIGLGLSVDFINLGWIRSATSIVLMFPISISGIGVREATFVHLLGSCGISPEKALAFSLVVFAQRLVYAFTGGWFEFKRRLILNAGARG